MTHYIQATHIHAASPFLAVLDEVEALKLIAFVWNDWMLVTMQVSHASGFSLCDDALAACRRMCLTQHVPLDCCHRDCGQHGLVCRSRNFQRGCCLAHAFSFTGQFALIARGRPVTLSRFQITRRTSLRFENPLKILAALLGRSLSAEKHLHMTLVMEDMTATYHLPGVAGGWQARSFNTHWDFDSFGIKLVWNISCATSAGCSWHSLASTALLSLHFRVPEFDRGEMFVKYLARRLSSHCAGFKPTSLIPSRSL